MKNLANDAKRMSLLLDYGVATIDDIVAWADAWILRTEAPPEALIDLAFARSRSFGEIVSAFGVLNVGADCWTAFKGTFPALRDYVILHPQMAETIANKLLLTASRERYRQTLPDLPAELRFLAYFDDAFFLAREGYQSDQKAVYDEFVRELSKFDVTSGSKLD